MRGVNTTSELCFTTSSLDSKLAKLLSSPKKLVLKKFQIRAGGRIFEEIPLMSSMSSTSSSSLLLMSVQMRFIRFRKKSQRDGEGREGLKNGGPVENVGLIRGDRCTHMEWTCSLHHTKMTRHRLLLKGGTSAYCV